MRNRDRTGKKTDPFRIEKAEWLGVGLSDAFRSDLSFHLRLSAQRKFYREALRIQRLAAEAAGESFETTFQPQTKIQLSPVFSGAPAALSVRASLGLTALLEYARRREGRALTDLLRDYLIHPAQHDDVSVHPGRYRALVRHAATAIENRLAIHFLARNEALRVVNDYRYLLAALQPSAASVPEDILDATILYADLHAPEASPPSNEALCWFRDAVFGISRFHLNRIRDAGESDLSRLGIDWLRALAPILAYHLARTEPYDKPDAASGESSHSFDAGPNAAFGMGNAPGGNRGTDGGAASAGAETSASSAVSPSAAILKRLAEALPDEWKPETFSSESGETIVLEEWPDSLLQALEKATESPRVDAQRTDRVEKTLLETAFREGPFSGAYTEARSVRVKLGDFPAHFGDLYDRCLDPCPDPSSARKLLEDARPLAARLKQTLYPNVESVPRLRRFQPSGILDAQRLAVADFSESVFKRYRIRPQADPRGAPVLLIACDGSASLDKDQMRMLKRLCAAWLLSLTGSRVRLLAGVYHSGLIHGRERAPLVQWLYHPRKTPAVSLPEAARNLALLPVKGTGRQADALSLSFLLDEARDLARGQMVYLVLLTDCAWNRSFDGGRTGREEVLSFFEHAGRKYGKTLRKTLIALGVDWETGLEDLFEQVLRIPSERLSNPAEVAESVGIYVASCLRARRKLAWELMREHAP